MSCQVPGQGLPASYLISFAAFSRGCRYTHRLLWGSSSCSCQCRPFQHTRQVVEERPYYQNILRVAIPVCCSRLKRLRGVATRTRDIEPIRKFILFRSPAGQGRLDNQIASGLIFLLADQCPVGALPKMSHSHVQLFACMARAQEKQRRPR